MNYEQSEAYMILRAAIIFIDSLDTCNNEETRFEYAKKHASIYVMQVIENNPSSYWKKVQEGLDDELVHLNVAFSFMKGKMWEGSNNLIKT